MSKGNQPTSASERKLYSKFANINGRSFRGDFVQVGPGKFEMRVFEEIHSDVEEEEITTQNKIVQSEKLRPYGKLKAEDKVKRQAAIDKWLEDEGVSVSEAISEKMFGRGKTKTAARMIEHALGFEVEKYLMEERKQEEIPIVKIKKKTTEKKLVTLDHYVKMFPHAFRISLINFVKSI